VAPHLRTLVSGGAKLDPAVEAELEALGWHVLVGYGLVETSAVATLADASDKRRGSAGRPSESVALRIRPVEGMAHGEIQVRGPIVFDGYAGTPEANAAAFTEDGWFRTGDLGWVDDDGYLFIAGRLKETIVLPGGKNVYPEDVEAVYGDTELVEELAVVERDGKLVALVRTDGENGRDAGDGDGLARRIKALGHELPRHMRVSEVLVTGEEFPKNQLGKLKRHGLGDIVGRATSAAGG